MLKEFFIGMVSCIAAFFIVAIAMCVVDVIAGAL